MTTTRRTIRTKLVSFLFATLGIIVAAHAGAEADADFMAAKAAYERSDFRALDALAPSLVGHPLERYVRYWQIKSRIDEAPADAVESFLERYPDGPLADRLRVEWLKALARRGEFERFATSYIALDGDDTELACDALQYRYQRDGAQALASAKPLWFTGASTPDACEPLFAALIARGDIGLADRKTRLRLAIARGNVRLARSIGDDLPGKERITEREFAAIDRNPQKALEKGRFDWKSPAGRELALYALDRAARKDAADAHRAWLRVRGRLSKADRDYGNLRIAWYAARQLDPSANAWFNEVEDIELTPEQRAWRVRAALRVRAWRDVEAAIAALPASEQQEPVWSYWRARALAARGESDKANALFAEVAQHIDYYGMLAAEALGKGPELLAKLDRTAGPIDEAALATFGARDDVKRAVLLARFDLRVPALREWAYAVRGLDDDSLLLAAEFARRTGLYDRAIYTAERTSTRVDFAMRYLTPYRTEFAAASRDQGLDEELLYGIARQESRFVADIVSSAGAVGLMQLMPGTARWVAKQLAVADYSPSRIADVDLNTQFGAFYFRHWLDRLDGLPALAAAAYNAGPSRAQAWRPAASPMEGAIWVETIPFDETRNYVKRVLANAMLYTRALDRPYVPLTKRLGVVAPRDFDNIAATEP
jgi:soluble lytic murein transglycosylase